MVIASRPLPRPCSRPAISQARRSERRHSAPGLPFPCLPDGPRADVVTRAGLLAYRELDNALALMAIAGQGLADTRTGKNGRHVLIGMPRLSVFGRLAG